MHGNNLSSHIFFRGRILKKRIITLLCMKYNFRRNNRLFKYENHGEKEPQVTKFFIILSGPILTCIYMYLYTVTVFKWQLRSKFTIKLVKTKVFLIKFILS